MEKEAAGGPFKKKITSISSFQQESAAAYQDFCLKNQRRSMEDVLKKLAAKGMQNDYSQEREKMNGDK